MGAAYERFGVLDWSPASQRFELTAIELRRALLRGGLGRGGEKRGGVAVAVSPSTSSSDSCRCSTRTGESVVMAVAPVNAAALLFFCGWRLLGA
jgi:hypothetical protein